jgi:hypothetical protein
MNELRVYFASLFLLAATVPGTAAQYYEVQSINHPKEERHIGRGMVETNAQGKMVAITLTDCAGKTARYLATDYRWNDLGSINPCK